MEPLITRPERLTEEISRPIAAWPTRPSANPNRTLLEETGGRWGEYADLLKESQTHACLQVRKSALVGSPWRLEPSSQSNLGKRGTQPDREWIESSIRALDPAGLISSLMDAIVLGYKVAEVIWAHEAGRWIPTKVLVRPNDRFAFDAEGSLFLVDPRHGRTEPVSEKYKFLVATWGPMDGNRYGVGLGEMLYYLAWFKRENLKFWLSFNDKHAYPTPVASLPDGATDEEMIRMRDQLAGLRDQSVIVHREGTSVRYLEAERSSTVETFRDLIEFCNAEIAKVILGQTLTTAAPTRGASGSYALGKVHNAVRGDIRAGDAAWAEALMDRIAEWMIELNYGKGGLQWRFKFGTSETLDNPPDKQTSANAE